MPELIRERELALDLSWVSICQLSDLEPFWGEAVLLDGQQFALFLFPDGELYAVSNRDPESGAFVMSRGIVGSKGLRRTIASPLHKELYDLATGECLSGGTVTLPVARVRVIDGVVELATAVGLEVG